MALPQARPGLVFRYEYIWKRQELAGQTTREKERPTCIALAVSGATRSRGFPDLPTVAEAGVPGYEAPTWTGVIAPAGVPRPIVDKLNAAINRAIRSPTFQERFAQIGDEPGGGTPEDFAALIRRDSAKWAEVIARSGAKIN